MCYTDHMFTLPIILLSAALHLAITPSSDQQVIVGTYADADIVSLNDGTYLMYYAIEPDAGTHNFEIYVAESTNGTEWTQQEDAVLTLATFPDAIQLSNGQIRLYFQRAGEIYSAVSDDGLTDFVVEDGVRISSETRLETDGVAAPTVVQRSDGTYYMIFRVAVPRRYTQTSVNTTTTALVAATSTDGLSWERQGVVVNGRHTVYDGYVDGPELYYTQAGKLRLRFWAPGGDNAGAIEGQFAKKSRDEGVTWRRRTLIDTDILGGDPTYAYINNLLHMYYTVRHEGIYLHIL